MMELGSPQCATYFMFYSYGSYFCMYPVQCSIFTLLTSSLFVVNFP